METDEIMDKVYTKSFEEGRESPVNFAGDLVEAIKITREDTATQIFAELDKIIEPEMKLLEIKDSKGQEYYLKYDSAQIAYRALEKILALKSKYDIK